jgi:hypothetical protein
MFGVRRKDGETTQVQSWQAQVEAARDDMRRYGATFKTVRDPDDE